MNRIRMTTWVLAMAWSAASPAQKAEQGLVADLRACMLEKDDARRLSCFDEMARPYQETGAQPAVAPAAQAAVAAPRAQPATAAAPEGTAAAPEANVAAADAEGNVAPDAEERFGFRGDVARAELDQEQAETSKLERLTATITKIASLPRGQLVVTLDNGQVWRQKTANPHSRLKVGDEVTIRAGTLGSFWMSGPSGRATNVNRVQ